MAYDRLSFHEAVAELAERAGIELPHDGDAAQSAPDYSPLYRLLDAVAAYYRRQLREHPDAPRAVAYLKGRGLSGEIAARFGLAMPQRTAIRCSINSAAMRRRERDCRPLD